MDATHLPEILEIKESLTGHRKAFPCRLLEATSHSAVVLFVSTQPYRVSGLALPAGTITFGHFWTNRPYNAYHWLTPEGVTLAYYFNLSDHTHIAAAELHWRDLIVDVLLRPGAGQVEVLDEDELPSDLDQQTRADIRAAKIALLAQATALAAELEARAGSLWARAFGGPRP
jgi:predicted RNA-binding protein associated with RNAse of E/G family